jgi:hypothetical protein
LSFNYVCPAGTYINQIYGRYGQWNDAVGVKCSDGSDSGQYGGTNGGAYRTDCSSGFTGMTISSNFYGPYVGVIKPECNNSDSPVSGTYSGITETKNLKCPSGSVLGAVYGNYKDYINRVGFKCVTK